MKIQNPNLFCCAIVGIATAVSELNLSMRLDYTMGIVASLASVGFFAVSMILSARRDNT